MRPATVPRAASSTLPPWFEYKFAASDWPGYTVVTLMSSGSGAGSVRFLQ